VLNGLILFTVLQIFINQKIYGGLYLD